MGLAFVGAVLLPGCVTVEAPAPAEPVQREVGQRPEGGGQCIADAAQDLVGTRATSESGAAAIAKSGARSLRWGPPGAVFTMDFRPDRVNVLYDAAMTIREIRCG